MFLFCHTQSSRDLGSNHPLEFTAYACYAAIMRLIFSLLVILSGTIAWVSTHPLPARAIVAEMKRRWRLLLIHRYGQMVAARLLRQFQHEAIAQGFDKELVEATLQAHKPALIEQIGIQVTNQQLGEPTPLERYF